MTTSADVVTEERLAKLIAEQERSSVIYCAMNGVSLPPVERLLTIAALRDYAALRRQLREAVDALEFVVEDLEFRVKAHGLPPTGRFAKHAATLCSLAAKGKGV